MKIFSLSTLAAFLLVASAVTPSTPAAATIYNYTLSGEYTFNAVDTPIFGTMTFDSDLGIQSIFVNSAAFESPYDTYAGAFYGVKTRLLVADSSGYHGILLWLDNTTSLFAGQTITIDSSFSSLFDIGPAPDYIWTTRDAVVSGTFAVASVPEPSTWALMLLGFAGVGVVTYRRRKITTA